MTIRTLLAMIGALALLTLWGCGSSSSGSGDRSLCSLCADEGTRIGCENAFNGCDFVPIDSARQACYIEVTQQFTNRGCTQ